MIHLFCLFRHRWRCESTTTGWICTWCGKRLSFDDHFKDRGERQYDEHGGSLAEVSTWSASPSWYWLHRCDRCRQRFLHERFYEVFPDAERDPDHGWWFECSRCIAITLTRVVEKAARDGKYPRTSYTQTEVRTGYTPCGDVSPSLHSRCTQTLDHFGDHHDRGLTWEKGP